MPDNTVCKHIEEIKDIKKSKENVCEECVKINSSWVHLRTCQECGATLCCDASPNTHMTKHYMHTKHPVITSAERCEKWMFCYPDDLFVEYD